MRVRLPLNLWTRNYVGSIFGGSIYGAVDPMHMMMLIKILGREYVVWDKAAAVRFKKPARATLYARGVIEDGEIEAIKEELKDRPSIDRTYRVELVDAAGALHAWVDKTIFIARKEEYKKRAGAARPFTPATSPRKVKYGSSRPSPEADEV